MALKLNILGRISDNLEEIKRDSLTLARVNLVIITGALVWRC